MVKIVHINAIGGLSKLLNRSLAKPKALLVTMIYFSQFCSREWDEVELL